MPFCAYNSSISGSGDAPAGRLVSFRSRSGPSKVKSFRDTFQVTVDDQGNFGCYGNCSSDLSVPLFTTVRILILPLSIPSKKLDAAKISFISTFTLIGSLMAVVSGCIWYKWSKRTRIKVEELVEPKETKQKFYDPLWIPDEDEDGEDEEDGEGTDTQIEGPDDEGEDEDQERENQDKESE